MPEVPRVQTPFQEASIAELLRIELMNQKLDAHRDMAALLLAQIAFETGRGRSCQNFNVGNITAFDNGAADFYRPVWFTVDGNPQPNSPWATNRDRLLALHEAMLKGQAPRAFRAYPSFTAGVAGYLFAARHLGVVEAARSGDAEVTANAIKHGGYTPDAPSSLGRTLDGFRNDYLARGLFETVPLDRAAPTPRDRGF